MSTRPFRVMKNNYFVSAMRIRIVEIRFYNENKIMVFDGSKKEENESVKLGLTCV